MIKAFGTRRAAMKSISAVLLGLLFFFGGAVLFFLGTSEAEEIGFKQGVEYMQAQAVERGFAEWYVYLGIDDEPKVGFRWKLEKRGIMICSIRFSDAEIKQLILEEIWRRVSCAKVDVVQFTTDEHGKVTADAILRELECQKPTSETST